MRTIRNLALCILHFAFAFAAALSGVAKTFDVDISTGRPAASNEAYYHGETIEFRAVRGRSVVTNIEYSSIYYQTNGMGDVWWRTDGLTFHPTNDVGAASYRFFLEGRDDLGRDWHANGLLRLLPSPGFTPNEIELPVARLDFANIEVFNAPYYDKAETEAKIVELAPTPGDYATVSNAAVHAAITNALQDAAISTLTDTTQTLTNTTQTLSNSISSLNDTKANKSDVTLTPVYSDTPTFSEWTFSDVSDGITDIQQPVFIPSPGGEPRWKITFVYDGLRRTAYAFVFDENATNIAFGYHDEGLNLNFTATRERTDIIGYTLGDQTDKPLQPKGDYATIDDIPDVSDFATREEVEPAITAYPRVYSFILGATNANFVVTNYQLTAEADAERMHFDPSDTDLDFSTVPSSLRLEDASTGTNRVVVDSRDWTVWYFAQKIGKAIHTASTNAIETCRAWVNFTATGEENPIDDTLIIDVPNIWLMAGKTFEKHVASSNSCWVIRSKDVAVPISDNAQSAGGFLELTDAFGEPYMRFNKTDSYFVDPAADGIEYDSATGAWLVYYSTTNCPMGGANAVIEGSATYPGKAILKAEDDPDCPATITWTGSANNWVMHAVPKPVGGVVPPKMFFGAVVEVEGQDYIEYLRPMSIPHLLVDGAKIAPEIPASHPVGTTVPWKVVQ